MMVAMLTDGGWLPVKLLLQFENGIHECNGVLLQDARLAALEFCATTTTVVLITSKELGDREPLFPAIIAFDDKQ